MQIYNQTKIKVNLNQIEENLINIRKLVSSNVKILVAVKANAYGHGSIGISRVAEKSGVDWLGIATTQEGVHLRQAGIRLPILKLSPAFPEEMDSAIENNLTLSVSEFENTRLLEEKASKRDKICNVHLALETGMGRIGASEEEATELASFIEKECPHLYLEGIFSHLSTSDDENSNFSIVQHERFTKGYQAIINRISRRVDLLHLSNSGGILNYPETWHDMVRPGLIAYGYYPNPKNRQPINIKPALSFVSRISFIKKVKTGVTIGYGNTWTAQEDCWIGTFPAGYADGLDRRFSNSGTVLIHGEYYSIVGRVCMDQTMVNLGTVNKVIIGDEVVLIGKSGDNCISCDDWSASLGTIPNEVLTRIGHRSEIVYC